VRNFGAATGETRLMAWDTAWKGFEARPLTGWGWGNYEAIFSTYYNPHFLKFSFTETVWDKPHNWFLEIMDSSGIVGFALYVGILVVALVYSFKLVQRNALSPLAGLVLIGTIIAYVVQNIFLFEITNTLLPFFLLLAFISGTWTKVLLQNKADRISLNVKPAPSIDQKSNQSGVGFFVVKGLLVFSLLISLWVGCFLPLESSYYLQQAREPGTIEAWTENAPRSVAVPIYLAGESAVFLAEQFVRLERAGYPVIATSTVETAVLVAKTLHTAGEHSPRTIAYPAWASQVYMILGEHVDDKYYLLAKAELERAVAISPKKQDILFLLGRYYLLTKQFPEAIQVHKDALAADPSIGQSYWFLGLAYSASGNIPEALKNIELAEQKGFGLSRDQQLYVIDLYAHEKRYDDLIVRYKKLRDQDPDAVEWYVKLATAYALKGDKAAALQTVEEVLRFDPTIKESAEAFIKKYNLR
jgi:tetratricopeptide (TPR) repeat protein